MDEKNELQLSRDLNVITAEINSYKQVAGQAIFEIGRRLKHVKEHDLVHGEWDKWCNEELGFSRRYANQYIKVAEEFGENGKTYSQLGVNALYHIATLPQEEREKEHVTSKGETKTVDEMTVRELQEVKRKNRDLEQAKQQAESQAEQYKKSEKIARDLLEKEQNKEPKVVEKEIYKEIDNTDYNRINELEDEKRRIEMELNEIKNDKNKVYELKEELERLNRTRDEFLSSLEVSKLVGVFDSKTNTYTDDFAVILKHGNIDNILESEALTEIVDRKISVLQNMINDYQNKKRMYNKESDYIDMEII